MNPGGTGTCGGLCDAARRRGGASERAPGSAPASGVNRRRAGGRARYARLRARASGTRARAGVREGERARGGAQAGGPARGRQRGRLGGHRDRRARAGLEDPAGHQRHVPRPGAAPAPPFSPLCPIRTLPQPSTLARLAPPTPAAAPPARPGPRACMPQALASAPAPLQASFAWLCLRSRTAAPRSAAHPCICRQRRSCPRLRLAAAPGGCARRSGSYDRALRGPPHAVPRLTRGARPRAVEVGVAQPQGLRELSARRGAGSRPPRARAGPGAARAAAGAAHGAGRARRLAAAGP